MDKFLEIAISYIAALYHDCDDILTTISILLVLAVSVAAYSVELARGYYCLACELLKL
jgi:hypothetical protein